MIIRLEVLIEYVALIQHSDRTIESRKEILREQREQLAARMKEMQKQWICSTTKSECMKTLF
jgi:DNA-binding transcriptional MerR regulator